MSRYGLDEQFLRFVSLTMTWTVVIGLALSAVRIAVAGGAASIGDILIFIIFWGVFSACIGLVAFAVWLRPSALIFSAAYRIVAHRRSERTAAMIAGSVTALAASVAFWLITTLILRDFDSIFALIILFGPISIIVAPLVAGRIYQNALAEVIK